MERNAYFGDVHGELEQLEKLHRMLQHYSLDGIYHSGDLVDRGPDSAGVVQFCRERQIPGKMGNHDSVILEYWKSGKIPQNKDKARTKAQLDQDVRNWEYLAALPYSGIHHDNKLLHVHAGYTPYRNFYHQGLSACNASFIHPDFPEKSNWPGKERKKRKGGGVETEADLRAAGWVYWYEIYNQPYDVIFGHKTFAHDRAFKYETLNQQTVYGLDTGAWFSKNLTAIIYPDLIFVSTKHGEYRL